MFSFYAPTRAWNLLYADTAWPIVNASSSENKVLVCQRTAAGASRVIQINTNGTIEKTITQAGIISFPRSALSDNSTVWIADFFGGLSNFSSSVQQFIPNGPLGTASGDMVFNGPTLYAAAGSVDDAWNYQFNHNGIYLFSNGSWGDERILHQSRISCCIGFYNIGDKPERHESLGRKLRRRSRQFQWLSDHL